MSQSITSAFAAHEEEPDRRTPDSVYYEFAARLTYWQAKGYRYINPLPLSVKDVRYLDQPQLEK